MRNALLKFDVDTRFGFGFPREIPRNLPIRRDFRDGNLAVPYDHGTGNPQKYRGNTA